MKSPFSINFTKRLDQNSIEIENIEILKKFKSEFDKTWCDSSKIVKDSKLIVRNEFIRIKPDLNFNLWAGVQRAELMISSGQNDEKKISYRIYFSKLSLSILFAAIFFFLMIYPNEDNPEYLKSIFGTLGLIMLSIAVLTHSILIIRHRSIFSRIFKEIKNGQH